MCLQKIKEFVVGQYQSYKDLSLERQVADLEREMQALKSRQRYGVDQISYVIGETLLINSKTDCPLWSSNNSYIYGIASVSGAIKDKTLVGRMGWYMQSGINYDNVVVYLTVKDFHGSGQDWYIMARRHNLDSEDKTPFTIRPFFEGNMNTGITFSWLA